MNTPNDNNQSNSNYKPSPFGGAGGGFMVVFGMVLITASFIVPPTGYIDPTVLTAFGEMLTFAGSLIGIDYHYRQKTQEKCDEGRWDRDP